MRDNLIIGLDIGSSHVRAVAGRQNNGQLDIIATGKSNTSGYLLHGNIVNINKTSQAISDVISQIETVISGKNKDYYFSSNLSGNHINVFLHTSTKLRKNSNEAVSEKEILELNEEAKKAIAEKLAEILDNINFMHPFREGNGRAQREFIRTLAFQKGYFLNLNPPNNKFIYDRYMKGTIESDVAILTALIFEELTLRD